MSEKYISPAEREYIAKAWRNYASVAEIAAAVKSAKAFRDKLEAAGISYHKLLALEEARRDMNDLARHILLGWENGEGFPNG